MNFALWFLLGLFISAPSGISPLSSSRSTYASVLNLETGSVIAIWINAIPAAAVLIDFNNTGVSEGNALTTLGDVTFTNAIQIEAGGSFATDFFNGNSSGSGAGGFDNAGTGNSAGASTQLGTIIIEFSVEVFGVAIDILDVEAVVSSGVAEQIELRMFADLAGTTPLATSVLTGGDPGTGDGVATTVVLGGSGVRRLEIQKIDPGIPAASAPGYGIDNLSYSVLSVPEPSSLALMGAGILGLGVVRRLRRRELWSLTRLLSSSASREIGDR